MPELPEAQTIATGIEVALKGRRVAALTLRRRDFLKTGRPADLKGLVGKRLKCVARHGKYVILDFDGQRLLIQLGMSGSVTINPPTAPLPRHTHLVITFSGGRELRYANIRRIASGVHLLGEGERGPMQNLGPDALAITAEEFVGRMGRRKLPIKAALLNQSILAGVGNIYADESLFRSGIDPRRQVKRIRPEELSGLLGSVRQVLTEAVRAGGSTLRTSTPYANVHGGLGDFTTWHRAYGKYGQPCPKCGTTFKRTAIGGRTTTYCPKCQK